MSTSSCAGAASRHCAEPLPATACASGHAGADAEAYGAQEQQADEGASSTADSVARSVEGASQDADGSP